MDIIGEYAFDVPRSTVWEALQNPIVLATVIPTCWGVEKIGDNLYTGTLLFKVGSMQGTFKGTIKLSNLVELEGYDIVVEGKSLIGVVKVSGNIKLESQAAQTIMYYTGRSQFGGRIAGIGQRLIEATTDLMIKQSFDALNKYLIKRATRQ
jgi:uncharacterized protein